MNKFEHYKDLIIVLTQKEIKVRYKSTVFGFLWSIGHPLAFALVFFIAFKVVMRIQMENYALFLITGLFPWQWLANSASYSPLIYLANASIIKKVNFPRNTLPLTAVLQEMIHFLLSIPVIVLFMFCYKKTPSASWLYGIPVLILIQFFMNYGISLAISSMNLFFRDIERLTGIFMTLLFYFTPIIYPVTMIPEKYQPIVNLNPFAPIMVSWRSLFLNGTLEPVYLLLSFCYSIAAFLIGYFIYQKLSWKFAEVL